MNNAQENTHDVNEQETTPTETIPPVVDVPTSENGQAAWETERAQLTKERDEYLDQWKRSAADFINFKKREERLRLDRERGANQRVLRKLLPILDDFNRGAQHRPADLVENEWANGILAIERKLWSVLEQEGITPIDASAGTEFDPNLHDAIVSQEVEGAEAGTILTELERGYKHYDTVLRPSRVVVAK